MIKLGERIKEFRQRDGRTQDALAEELGVTAQAVSRWEKGICYPDMEVIPSIANYFNVSIDVLFGYDHERSKRVDALAGQINEMIRLNNGKDVSMDECIALAREALIEFPGNEKLTLALASALFIPFVRKYGSTYWNQTNARQGASGGKGPSQSRADADYVSGSLADRKPTGIPHCAARSRPAHHLWR